MRAETMAKTMEKRSDTDHAQWLVDRYNREEGQLKGYNCDICRNKGHIMLLQNGVEVLDECKCMKVRAAMRRIEKSGLKEKLKECNFDTFKVSEAWQERLKHKALSFASSPGNGWFFIGGQPGSGKTHLCTAIAGKLLGEGKEVRYMLWREESVKLKTMVNDTEYSRIMDEFKSCEILYIDDFFKGERGKAPTSADINLAFELLDRRIRKITVISSEKTISELMETDEAIGSRIFGQSDPLGNCLNIQLDRNKNQRLKERKKLQGVKKC